MIEELAPGRKTHGFIAFDIPRGAGEIVYTPSFGGTGGSWTIPAA